MESTVLVQRYDIDRIAVLVLTNPPANGYSHAMHKELDAQIVDLRMAEGIDVIVIRGEGDKFFCAGADIAYLSTLTPEQKYAFCLHANETLLRLENTPKLVIAALNGHCVGGGLEIALACDLRIGRMGNAKPDLLGLPEVSLGVLPGTGGTQRLTRILGRAKALEFMVEGQNVTMPVAASMGLVHSVLPADGWWAKVLDYARKFCRPHKSATAVGLIKRAVLGGADLPLESGLALERELQQRLFTGPDAREGLAAFADKRPAVFSIPPTTGAPSRASGAPPIAAPAPAAAVPPPAAARPAAPPAPPPAAARPAAPAPSARPASTPATAAAANPNRDLVLPDDPAAEPTRTRPASDDRRGRETLPARRPAHLVRADPPSAFGDDATNPGVQDPSAGKRGSGPTAEGYFEDAFDAPTGRTTRTTGTSAGAVDVERSLGNVKDAVLNLVPREIVEKYLLIPLRRDGDVLTIAMVDPGKVEGIQAVEDETRLIVKALKATDFDISAAITRYYRA